MQNCVTSTTEGQYVLTHCSETGHEGIYSGSTQGSFNEWYAEHTEAHMRHARAAGHMAVARERRGRTLYGLKYSGQ